MLRKKIVQTSWVFAETVTYIMYVDVHKKRYSAIGKVFVSSGRGQRLGLVITQLLRKSGIVSVLSLENLNHHLPSCVSLLQLLIKCDTSDHINALTIMGTSKVIITLYLIHT